MQKVQRAKGLVNRRKRRKGIYEEYERRKQMIKPKDDYEKEIKQIIQELGI